MFIRDRPGARSGDDAAHEYRFAREQLLAQPHGGRRGVRFDAAVGSRRRARDGRRIRRVRRDAGDVSKRELRAGVERRARGGRPSSAATGATFSGAEIYSYSRSSGIFAGVALDGTAISIDKKANADFYGERRVGELSGGMKKRVALAQALVAVWMTRESRIQS